MDKDDKKADSPVQAAGPAKPADRQQAPAEHQQTSAEQVGHATHEVKGPFSAPTIVEGRVDPLDHLRNEAGQLSPEDGAAPDDEVADELKRKFSGEGGGTF